MKKILLSATMIFFAMGLTAQVAENSVLQVKSANVQIGFYSGNSVVSNLSDFQKLAPNSTFQESDIVGFRAQNSFYGSSGQAFSMNLVFDKPTSETLSRLNAEFRFGLSYQQADIFYLSYGKTNRYRVDTLTSSRKGEQTFIDSVYSQDYTLSYTQRHVMVDADIVISTNPNKRWKFYGGIGLSVGLSVAPYTTISYDTRSNLEEQDRPNDGFNSDFEFENTTERFRNDGGFFGRVYMPLGVDFRIGKRKESLKKYHLFSESRPSLTFQSVPELNMISTTANVTSFGLRYDF